jgi:hypothetical protein
VQGLQVELILALLGDGAQVRPQGSFRDRLGIVVVVLLPFVERLDVDRRDDPRLEAHSAQCPADEMRAQAGLHADDATRKLLEGAGQGKTLDLLPQDALAIRIEPDEMEDVLPDIDANDHKRRGVVFGRGCHRCSSSLAVTLRGYHRR